MSPRLARRSLLGGLLAAACPVMAAEPGAPLVTRDLRFPRERGALRSVRVLYPGGATGPLPGLVLLHGLGEWNQEELGLRAYPELYGLASAFRRLAAPPVLPTRARGSYLTPAHQAHLARTLARRAFRGVVALCPTTPNPWRQGFDAVERFGDWLLEVVLPAAREVSPLAEGPLAVGLDGCSMGGLVALELFIRRPGRFATLGAVQAAFSAGAVPSLAERLARSIEGRGPVPVRLGSSSADPYRDANRALAAALRGLGVPVRSSELPGPHDQHWLREIGTLDMLLWHDRMLGAG